MKISVLCNDTALKGFEVEHGLSLLIEANEHSILFDTGSTDVAVKNAAKLGLNLSNIDFIVVSHGHYDHIGGLKEVLKITRKKKVYTGPGCLFPRYSGPKFAGSPESEAHYGKLGADFEVVDQTTTLENDIFLLPAVPFRTAERPSRKFKRMGGEERFQDLFEDELSLIVIENGRATLFTGCSHRGIGNILLETNRHWNIKTVVGGLHLSDKTRPEIEEVCRLIKEMNIESFYIGHCTGNTAIEIFKEKLPATVKELKAGQIITI
ncbi:MBL fold metallo-hydrolase [Kosmotoga pacifica]|uniref:Metallo-beta-lactamase domain-containing protein n=1 Tax=Kosmotoga pacifica TaxID=1330330 RepID=A0A0G2ZBD0_9BACT|nr:MBL fold metallo-hydrolase [Kosmotoga pacifica]AKI97396.1 hypothetical protein IX53_05705 [Kosmotoga pacifica]